MIRSRCSAIVEHGVLPQLAAWEAFYVIIGTSAAALTGLQFVVIVLGAEVNALSRTTAHAFATPTVVHFCAVLLISAILSAPWGAFWGPAVGLGGSGIAGILYAFMVIRGARQQTDYAQVLEDWLFHGVRPFIAYVALLASAVMLGRHPVPALFVIDSTAVLLLFVGIHNAWDAVTYIALERRQKPERTGDQK